MEPILYTVIFLALSAVVFYFLLPYMLTSGMEKDLNIDSRFWQYMSSRRYGYLGYSSIIYINSYLIKSSLIYYKARPGKKPLPFVVYKSDEAVKLGLGDDEKVEIGTGYHGLSPTMRGHYLNWLQGGRRDKDVNIALLFIYLYGLEYRASEKSKEQGVIFTELERLYLNYRGDKKFAPFIDRVEKFMTYLLLKIDDFSPEIGEFIKEELEPILPDESPIYTSGAYLRLELLPLAETVIAGWISRLSADRERSIPAHFRYILDEYLMLKGQSELKRLTTDTQLAKDDELFHYSPALDESYFKEDFSTAKLKLNIEQYEIDKLSRLREQCLSELNHIFNKHRKSSLYSVIPLLPEELQLRAAPWAVKKMLELDTKFHPTSVTFFAKKTGMELDVKGEYYSYTDSAALSTYFENLGYSVEPDARIIERGYRRDEIFVCYKSSRWNSELNREYKEAALLHDLAKFILFENDDNGAGSFGDAINLIEESFCPNSELKERLFYRNFAMESVSQEKNDSAAELTVEDKKRVATLFFRTALLDGSFTEDKVELLKELFADFALDSGELERLKDEYMATAEAERGPHNLERLKNFFAENPDTERLVRGVLKTSSRRTGEIVE